MAGPPALHSYASARNVNDSPYSRILQEIDEEARKSREPITEQRDLGGDEAATTASDDSNFDDDDDDDDDDDQNGHEHNDNDGSEDKNDDIGLEAHKSPAQPLDKFSASPTSAEAAPEDYVDLAQMQKKQAWLRGGGGEREDGRARRPDISDTASLKSSAKRKMRQPGLLEALFLPHTYAAAHNRTMPSKSNASIRPQARRVSTTDLAKPSKAPSTSETTASSAKSDASARVRTAGKDSKRSSAAPASTKPPAPPASKVECVSCLDEIPKQRSALLECKHRMCYACLKRVFTLSTEDPQLMPPRCCTEEMIPLRHADRLFSTSFKAIWNRKYAEYTTKHRLYCPTKDCGEWIKPKYIEVDRATGRKVGKCKECKTKVCKKCGLKWHGSRECENDESTRRVIDLGKEMGWQRCYNCRAMVQLSEGCNHMRCRCNAEFCMVCAQKWKTCNCPWFNLPPEIGVEGYLDPGQDIPMPPLGLRIGPLPPLPPLPPGFGGNWNNVPLPSPPPLMPFRDRRDMPLDPLDPGDIFRPPNLDRLRTRRRRTMPAQALTPQEQQAADEELARQLQEQELADSARTNDDIEARERRRASRRARRTVHAFTEDDGVYRLGDNGEEHPLISGR